MRAKARGVALPEPRPQLWRRGDAIAGGYSDAELARRIRRGEIARLQRGTYLTDPAAMPDEAAARHRLTVTATMAELRLPTVVSHVSAAAMHGLPLWGVRLNRVHVLRQPPASGASNARLHLHVARCEDDDVTAVEGIALTTVTRTVVDVARTESFEAAVSLADAALFRRQTSPPRLRECLARMGPVPGVRAATRVLYFADGRSESVGESRSRVAMHRLGLPVPDLQPRVLRRDATEIGRCDFGWEQFRTLGEFDGRLKYGRLLRPGQQPGDAVFEEKRREDELRDHRWEVARWIWRDLDRPRVIEERIRRAFNRGRR
jgi:predicted transcriptional regulator of viral defense system